MVRREVKGILKFSALLLGCLCAGMHKDRLCSMRTYLHCLSQAHLIGQNAIKLLAPQGQQPSEALQQVLVTIPNPRTQLLRIVLMAGTCLQLEVVKGPTETGWKLFHIVFHGLYQLSPLLIVPCNFRFSAKGPSAGLSAIVGPHTRSRQAQVRKVELRRHTTSLLLYPRERLPSCNDNIPFIGSEHVCPCMGIT